MLGQDAVQRAAKFRPDLVVSALVLEDLRGVDVCVELKKLPGPQPKRGLLYGQVSALANDRVTENAQPDEATLAKANEQGVILLSTSKFSYEICGTLWEMNLR